MNLILMNLLSFVILILLPFRAQTTEKHLERLYIALILIIGVVAFFSYIQGWQDGQAVLRSQR